MNTIAFYARQLFLIILFLLSGNEIANAASMTASPSFLSLNAGASGTVKLSGVSGAVAVSSSNNSVATASYANGTVTVQGIKAGSAVFTVQDSATTSQVQVSVVSSLAPLLANANYSVLAWNDLGMHCMDGIDFSVFTILPPYNTLHAQLKDKSGKLVTSGVNLTYEAVPVLSTPSAILKLTSGIGPVRFSV